MERLISRLFPPVLAAGAAALVVMTAACQTGPSASEVVLRATVETMHDEMALARTGGATAPAAGLTLASTLGPGATPLATVGPRLTPTWEATPVGSPTARAFARSALDTRLLDWRSVDEQTEVGDLQLRVHAILLGQDTYGTPYGATIEAAPGTKIILADLTLRNAFRPGQSPIEVHVDFFVMGGADGLEYRGLPVPSMASALPDRFYLSSGQSQRGVVAFIVPSEMSSARLYFTNFLGIKTPPDRLTVYLNQVPLRASASPTPGAMAIANVNERTAP